MTSAVFKILYRVSWVDTDAAQVMHFSNYLRLFERAEEEFYRSLGFSFTELKDSELWLPRVEAFCQYKKPARFNDLLEIELRIEELRQKSVKYGFRIINKKKEELLALGYMTMVAADKRREKAIPIPEQIMEKLRSFANNP
ncbi:acyl-CoA thioesterase [Candidatus Bathyarchaeota archaeon]|nr:acyl-CoA thioesterase [Candidatus Bathyarchaeota archaeon]